MFLLMPQSSMEMWGGVECTINRVRNVYFDQLERSGHRARIEADLELFASMGLRKLRTGFHWEHVEAGDGWGSLDRTMSAMDSLRMSPIAGLVHHGSGPRWTSLLHPEFPVKLATHALRVAERYPSIVDYTPVNEPQTTGRFACLYGHWFPHHRSMRSYVRALYHQVKGIALSMAAIRTVQPGARLVHTEDGGETFATPQMEAYRVDREHRRWLGVDLLCGHVTQEHPMFRFLVENGLTEAEVLSFAEAPCPPDVLGLNYYVTSDRFLDHRLDLYPPYMPGGDSGAEPLVDTEAVRVHPGGIAGTCRVLLEAWKRYRIPLAITEAHLGSDPDEQIRWLVEVWKGAEDARLCGVDVRAVAVWALLGSYDWCDLVTRSRGMYEPGVFDLRRVKAGGQPRRTELGAVVTELAHGRIPDHPALLRRGWWHDADRFTIPPYADSAAMEAVGV